MNSWGTIFFGGISYMMFKVQKRESWQPFAAQIFSLLLIIFIGFILESTRRSLIDTNEQTEISHLQIYYQAIQMTTFIFVIICFQNSTLEKAGLLIILNVYLIWRFIAPQIDEIGLTSTFISCFFIVSESCFLIAIFYLFER